MGAQVVEGTGHRLEVPDGLRPASIYLDEASVTGTETALLAAAAAPGVSEIRHAACEPHVVELCEFLRGMGVGITGQGSHTIRVEGGMRLSGAQKRLDGDYIEAGSWAVVGAITGGEVEIGGTRPVDMEVVASVLRKMHVDCSQNDDVFSVRPSKLVGAGRITTGLWPGFPSDLVSLVTVLATRADGATLVHDWLYELRLFALEQMSGMGADLFLCDPHRIIVTGPCRLRGKPLDSRDIRSGMALIAAALAADGQSRVEPLETVERGYSRLVERLQALGADVSKSSGLSPSRELRSAPGGRGGGGGGFTGVAVPGAGTVGASTGPGGGAGSVAPARRRRLRRGRPLRLRHGNRQRRQIDATGCAVAADAERRQIRLGQFQHANDAGRQRQDDVGLLRLLLVVAQTAVR